MPNASGFEQVYNALASVDIVTLLIVGQHVSQNPNDKQQVAPALDELSRLPDDLGCIAKAAADSGYFSKHNTQQFEKADIEPYMPIGRQHHNPTLEERNAFISTSGPTSLMAAPCIRICGNATSNVKRNMDPRINAARSEIVSVLTNAPPSLPKKPALAIGKLIP